MSTSGSEYDTREGIGQPTAAPPESVHPAPAAETEKIVTVSNDDGTTANCSTGNGEISLPEKKKREYKDMDEGHEGPQRTLSVS